MATFLNLSSTAAALLLLATAIAILHSTVIHTRHPDTAGGGRGVEAAASHGESVSRDSFSVHGDVVWIVQVSDLHISSFHPERGDDLRSLLAPALRLIKPSLVLITGDITDAKNKERRSSRQDEKEWIQYSYIINITIEESGIDKRRFFDLRGNHDKYGVPCIGDKLDFFSIYSISSQHKRVGTVQSISLVGKDWRYIFLGIDDTMRSGIRGPSHLFGHPTDKRISIVESELQQWDKESDVSVAKIVFGHFPMSFTSSSETGNRYERIFAKHSVCAYLCGHLHATFGDKLWRKHTVYLPSDHKQKKEIRHFLEWELGDWKEFRFIRILAIDHGLVSFVDIALANEPGRQRIPETVILITHPIDSRKMGWNHSKNHNFRTDIHALVFSLLPIVNVTAKIYDSLRSFAVLEEISLKLKNDSPNHQFLFHSSWDAQRYCSTSPTRYWVQIFAFDSHGKEFSSEKRPFSANGKAANIPTTWLSYLLLHLSWQKLYLLLLWSNISFLVLLLLLPKLVTNLMDKNASNLGWKSSMSAPIPLLRKVLYRALWFLLEGSRNGVCWYSMAFYLVYLVTLPWLRGHATSVNGEISKMFIFGWKIKADKCHSHEVMEGYPDVMTVTIPFMYLVISPSFFLIYSLFSERSAFYLHQISEHRCTMEEQSKKMISNHCYRTMENLPESKKDKATPINVRCLICKGQIRTAILFACFILYYIHFKQVFALMGAYGVLPVALSPAVCWAPPFLLAVAIYYSRYYHKGTNAR